MEKILNNLFEAVQEPDKLLSLDDKELLNTIQNTKDFLVRITFEVTCNSHSSMCDGKSLKERILDYIDQCTNAIDDSMRHWGDHYHDIEPIKVGLYDDNENLIEVTNEILD